MNGSFHMVRPVADVSTGKVNMWSGSFSTNYIWMASISLLRVFFPWWAFPKSSLPWPTHGSLLHRQVQHEWLGRHISFPSTAHKQSFAEKFSLKSFSCLIFRPEEKKTYTWLKSEDFIVQFCCCWWTVIVRDIFPYKCRFVNVLFLHLLFATQILIAL